MYQRNGNGQEGKAERGCRGGQKNLAVHKSPGNRDRVRAHTAVQPTIKQCLSMLPFSSFHRL